MTTINEILALWSKDSNLDRSELGEESLKAVSLHGKYKKIYIEEKAILLGLMNEGSELRLAKYIFYTQGPSKETQEKGWAMPDQGAIIKSEVALYMDADPDIIKLNMRISIQREKVDLLVDIIKEIGNRRWNIRSAIDFLKWTSGG